MSNFGFLHLRLVTPYPVAFREARSAVGAAALLASAEEHAVISALLPLGLGHALAVAAAVVLALLAGAVLPLQWLRWLVAGILTALGLSRLFRHRHPRWANMRVSAGALTLWSFLMASAHGAGLMLVPVFLGMSMANVHHAHHHAMAGAVVTPTTALLATSLHAVGYLIVIAVIALWSLRSLGLACCVRRGSTSILSGR